MFATRRGRWAIAYVAMLLTGLLQFDGTQIARASDTRPQSAEFLRLVQQRHSVRAYESRPVSRDAIVDILEAARAAPSAGNLQAYDIVVVEDAARRERLAQAALGQTSVSEAPVVLVFVVDPPRSAARYGERGTDLYCVQDASIAAAYAQLAATSLGLGSVWVGSFDEGEVLSTIGASSPHRAVALLAIGHAREKPAATSRRPLSDFVRNETFATHWSK